MLYLQNLQKVTPAIYNPGIYKMSLLVTMMWWCDDDEVLLSVGYGAVCAVSCRVMPSSDAMTDDPEVNNDAPKQVLLQSARGDS